MPQSIEELLVRLCRRDAAEGVTPADVQSLEDRSTADAFLEQSARHGVRALALLRLQEAAWRSSAAGSWLTSLLDPLARLRKQSALRDLEQGRVLATLRTAGVRTVVLKGGALRHVAYSTPLERWMGDLDLLVSPAETARTLAVLSALGYSSDYSEAARGAIEIHHYHHLVTHPAGFIVEVHQRLTRAGDPCSLDHVAFLERAREVGMPGGQPMLVPSHEDMILHLVSQIEQEGCRRLSRIVDLDRVVAAGGPLDWEDVGRRAEGGNLGVSLAVSLRLANLLLASPAPAWALDGRRLPRASRRGIQSTRPVTHLFGRQNRAAVAAEDLMRLWLLPSWGVRGAHLRSLAAARSDPLQWVWEGKKAPEEGKDEPRVGGPGRVLKLIGYQLWTGGLARLGERRTEGFTGGKFWADPH